MLLITLLNKSFYTDYTYHISFLPGDHTMKSRKPYEKKLAMGLVCGILSSIAGFYAGFMISVVEGYREEGMFGAAVGAALGFFFVGPLASTAGFVGGMAWGYTRGLPTLNTFWENSVNWLASISSQVKGKLPSVPAVGSTWNKLTAVVGSATEWLFSKKSLPVKSVAFKEPEVVAASSKLPHDSSEQSRIMRQKIADSATPYQYDTDPETGAPIKTRRDVSKPKAPPVQTSQSTHKSLIDKFIAEDASFNPAKTSTSQERQDRLSKSAPTTEPTKLSATGMLSSNGKKGKEVAAEPHSWVDTLKSAFGRSKKS